MKQLWNRFVEHLAIVLEECYSNTKGIGEYVREMKLKL